MSLNSQKEPDGEQKGETYAAGSPLTVLFGSHAKTKILAAVVSERGRDINVSEISRLAGVARSTVYDYIDEFEELGVIKQTRDVGNAKMYQWNEDNEMAQRIYELEGLALKRVMENQGIEAE